MKDSNRKNSYVFLSLVLSYILIITIDSNAWRFENSLWYILINATIFYIWLFYVSVYFIALFDVKRVVVLGIIFMACVIALGLYAWAYFLLMTLFLLVFNRTVFKNIFISLSIIFILSASFYYTMLCTAGLASDEEMIGHFKKYKTEIEELVKRYMEFDIESIKPVYSEVFMGNGKIEIIEKEYPHFRWIEQSDTKELMSKAGMYLGSREIFPAGYFKNRHTETIEPVIWLPNPYSMETAKLADKMYKESENMPSEGNYKPLQYSKKYYNKYGMLVIRLFPDKKYNKKTFYYESIRKYLYHIPEAPKIENGELLGPYDINGNYSFRWRINKSLNYILHQWNFGSLDDFKCAIRQIEPQWYIYMCAEKCRNGCNDTSLF